MRTCTNTTPWQVRCIQAHISANMHTALRTADLAGIVAFSSYRLKRVFQDNFDCTPHQYLIRRRVARAQCLLLISDDSISQIAAECGIVSQAHLSNMFHKIVGERPGRWATHPEEVEFVIPSCGRSELNDPALQADHGGVGSVLGA